MDTQHSAYIASASTQDARLPAVSQAVFCRSGVAAEKLVVIPEPVDTAFFDPAVAEALPLPRGELVFGRAVSDEHAQTLFNFVSVRACILGSHTFMCIIVWQSCEVDSQAATVNTYRKCVPM